MKRAVLAVALVVLAPVGARAGCSEIDRAAGLIAAIARHCAGQRITDAGHAMLDLATPACMAAAYTEHDRAVGRMATALGSPERAARGWCRAALKEHETQTRANGMRPWVAE